MPTHNIEGFDALTPLEQTILVNWVSTHAEMLEGKEIESVSSINHLITLAVNTESGHYTYFIGV